MSDHQWAAPDDLIPLTDEDIRLAALDATRTHPEKIMGAPTTLAEELEDNEAPGPRRT